MLGCVCVFFVGCFWGSFGVLVGFLWGSFGVLVWLCCVYIVVFECLCGLWLAGRLQCGWPAAGGAEGFGGKPAGVRPSHASARHWRPSARGVRPPAAAAKEAPLGPLNVAIIAASALGPAIRRPSAFAPPRLEVLL